MNATCSTCAFQLLTLGTWYDVMTSCDKLWQAVTSCGCYKLLTSCGSTVVPCQSCHWNLRKGAQLLWGLRANRMSRVWPCSQRCQDVPRCAKMCQDVPRCAKANVIKRQMNSNEMFHEMFHMMFHDVSSSGRCGDFVYWICKELRRFTGCDRRCLKNVRRYFHYVSRE